MEDPDQRNAENHLPDAEEPQAQAAWRLRDVVVSVSVGLVAGLLLAAVVVVFLSAAGADPSGPATLSLVTVAVYAGTFGGVYLLLIRRLGLTFAAVGFRAVPSSTIALMVPVALLMQMVVAIVVLLSAPILGDPPSAEDQLVLQEGVDLSIPEIFALVLGAALVAPIVEELVFRGLLYRYLRARWSVTRAVLLSSAVFALVHLAFPLMPALFVLGVALALAAERYGSLYPSIALHALHNGIAVLAIVTIGTG